MADKKHAVFVFRDMGTGGAQKIQAFVANACLKYGLSVSVISLSTSAVTVDLDESIPIVTLDYDTNLGQVSTFAGSIMRKIGFLFRLRRAITKEKPDLVCVFLTDVIRIVVHSLVGLGIPILASERGDPYQLTKKKRGQYARALNRCDVVVFQLEKARKAYELSQKLITKTIPNPCIPRQGIDFGNADNGQEVEKVVISAGRLHPQKRFDVLIQAFELLAREHPEFRLIIYGEGSERRMLENLINQYRLTQSVFLPGEVPNPFTVGDSPMMFALTSDYEGIPNVLIEAMGYGIPCISTDCSPGGASFLLDGGRRGYIVPVGDWESFGKGLVFLADNEESRKSYAERGREIFDLFSPIEIEKEWVSIVQECLERT